MAIGTVINSVLDFGQGQQIDLIMGTAGASGFREIFMGSVTTGTLSKKNSYTHGSKWL